MKIRRNLNLREKGITLVALVVTIIVLLILAGVTISLALSNNGIIQRAKDASEVYVQAEQNDINALASFKEKIGKYIGENGGTTKKITDSGIKPATAETTVEPLSTKGTTDLEDDKGNIVKVPKNFGIAYDSADNVTEGIVIEYVSPKANDPMTGNQYVWIPVDNGIKKSDGTTTVDISLIRSDFNGTTTTNAEDAISRNYYEYASNPEGKTYGNTKAKSLSSFIDSVSTNKGYYIARYEAGINATTSQYEYANCSNTGPSMTYGTPANMVAKDGTVKPLSKKGVGVWNAVTQPEASIICRAMYTKGNDGVESDLINSFAWDTAIDYIKKCGTSIWSRSYHVTNGESRISTSDPQTAGTNILNSTGAVDEECKIYDMAGNVWEWSTETYTIGSPCVYRGGYYYGSSNGTDNPRHRSDGYVYYRDKRYGFRTILYL